MANLGFSEGGGGGGEHVARVLKPHSVNYILKTTIGSTERQSIFTERQSISTERQSFLRNDDRLLQNDNAFLQNDYETTIDFYEAVLEFLSHSAFHSSVTLTTLLHLKISAFPRILADSFGRVVPNRHHLAL